MSDVMLRALGPMHQALAHDGLSLDELIEGLPCTAAQLRRRRGRIPWELFAEICARLHAHYGSLDRLETMAREHSANPRFELAYRVLSLAGSPRDFYWLSTTWFGRVLFGIVEARFEDLPDGRIREHLMIPAPHRDSPEFFHFVKGAIESTRSTLALDYLQVEMERTSRQATYTIAVPDTARRRFSPARLFFRGRTRSVVDALVELQEEFQRSHRTVRRTAQLGRELARHRDLDEFASALIEQLSGIFRFSGIELHIRPVGASTPDAPFELLRASGTTGGLPDRTLSLSTAEGEVGRLELWSTSTRPNDSGDDLDAVSELTPWISIALENARAHTALQARVLAQNRALEVANDSLHVAERLSSIGTFAAGIAHEINNPIGAILLASEYGRMGLEQGDIDGDARDAVATELDRISAEARRCGEIVKGVLRFARNEPGERKIEDVVDAGRRAVRLTARYAETVGVEVFFGAADESIACLMNAVEIEQVMVNLLRNAIEAMPLGGRVDLSLDRRDGWIEVEVRDRGRGITAEDCARIFDPFFTTRQDDGGTGLGLSIADGIVKAHGGGLRVESTPGVGTRISFRLPLPEAGAAAHAGDGTPEA